MRKIWVKVDPWDKKMVTTALEGGADGIMVPRGFSDKVKELSRIQTISEDGDLKIGEDVVIFTIKSGQDEEEIVKLSQNKKVILQCSDWTIIPLENLIAKGADVIAQVKSFEEAQTAFGILEKGVNHILFHAKDPLELKKALSRLRSMEDKTPLEVAKIVEIIPVGMGDRVCVDTCTSMTAGQGMLIGNSSSALFLVHSESISNPYVSPRPFRVNAGPVHAYTRVPDNKTKYLSDLSAGDQVIIVDFKGNTTVGIVGRLKIEKRPLMLIKAVVGDKEISTILQNAETIRLTDPEGKAVSVVNLKPGDEVLVAIEEGGRHFGLKIDETITEK
ncbi:MAG: 3-dehydroquinate synthase II [Desulfobacteraceae bacterium]|nr:3-dehydroquinate synthase II [Pseudomonadota bacterium]MBU4259514.1 3-dehydroquinate synthase II [Pseudomonadota bacterium]MBU4413851.1 3-dehydroquinate synthase II [Pseudomonadota bacterium]MCG2758449.1 3-dehydroquinate synthase II [Desulfobacteraceae bacterium]